MRSSLGWNCDEIIFFTLLYLFIYKTMANKSYTLKVSDILHNTWVKDTIKFTNKFSTLLPQIIDPWMSCNLTLISLSSNQLMIEVSDIKVPLELDCDYCWEQFTKTVTLDPLTTKASIEEIENEEFEIVIDEKTLQLNVEKRLLESIILALPVAKICEKCEQKDFDSEEVDPNLWSVEWNIQ